MPRLATALAISLATGLFALPAAAQPWPAGTLIAALSGDWNGDGEAELAVLLQGGDGADLVLHAPQEMRLVPVLTVPDVAFVGPMFGQTPSLAARSDTSFVIASEQTGIGRSPWNQQVTVAWRGGDWVVAGFTHTFYDRIDPDRNGRCDLNLLSGGWEREVGGQRQSGTDGPRAFPLAGLAQDWMPDVCRPIFD
jgi:hypothetical protein